MGSKQKQTQMDQKAYFEQGLEDRLSSLSKRGIESPRIDKDPLVKKLRAKIRAVNDRLKVIAAYEKRTAELAKIKAERAAAPPKGRERGKEKKAKEAPEEGKAKKKKPEKAEKPEMTQAPPKEQEGDKIEKTTEAPEEGKEKKKKKVKETAEAVGEGAEAPDQEKVKKRKKVTGETEEAADKAAEKAKENE